MQENIIIEQFLQKIISKYPCQKDIFLECNIELMWFDINEEDHIKAAKELGGNIFLLFSREGNLIAYFDHNANMIFDAGGFIPENDVLNSFNKKFLNTYLYRDIYTKKLVLYKDNMVHQEGSFVFNTYVSMYFKTDDAVLLDEYN